MVAEMHSNTGRESIRGVLAKAGSEAFDLAKSRTLGSIGSFVDGVRNLGSSAVEKSRSLALSAQAGLAQVPATIVRGFELSVPREVPEGMFDHPINKTMEVSEQPTKPMTLPMNGVGHLEQKSTTDTAVNTSPRVPETLKQAFVKKMKADKRAGFGVYSDVIRAIQSQIAREENPIKKLEIESFLGNMRRDLGELQQKNSTYFFEKYLQEYQAEVANIIPQGTLSPADTMTQAAKEVIQNKLEFDELAEGHPSSNQEFWATIENIEQSIIQNSTKPTTKDTQPLPALAKMSTELDEEPILITDEADPILVMDDVKDSIQTKGGNQPMPEVVYPEMSIEFDQDGKIVQETPAKPSFDDRLKTVLERKNGSLKPKIEADPAQAKFEAAKERYIAMIERLAMPKGDKPSVLPPREVNTILEILNGSKKVRGVEFAGVNTLKDMKNFVSHPYIQGIQDSYGVDFVDGYQKAVSYVERQESQPTVAETKLNQDQKSLMATIAGLPGLAGKKLTELFVAHSNAKYNMRQAVESKVLKLPRGADLLKFYKKHEYIIGRIAILGGRVALGAILTGILTADHGHEHMAMSHGVSLEHATPVHHAAGYDEYLKGEHADYAPTSESGYQEYRAGEREGFAVNHDQIGEASVIKSTPLETAEAVATPVGGTRGVVETHVTQPTHNNVQHIEAPTTKPTNEKIPDIQSEVRHDKVDQAVQEQPRVIKPTPSALPAAEVARSGSVMSGKSELEPNESDLTIGTRENWQTDERTGHTTFVTATDVPQEHPVGTPRNSENWEGNNEQRVEMTETNQQLDLPTQTARVDELLDRAMDRSLSEDAHAEARREILSIIDPDRSLVTQPRATVNLMTELYQANGNPDQLSEIIARAQEK